MMMETNKIHMHKIGLVDFWFYHYEEFHFEDGHMLLRGSNGSGKSVTMQSFIPLLLDGNKSSERLDPFGTRSRKLEDYLLKETSDREERIAYLYLEFKRENVELYTTIGIGLRARRNKPLDAWYFVIEDNRRINHDIMLMQNDLAIAKQTLKNMIGDQLIENQGEYQRRVNKAIFGFEESDYKDTINLLLQLRTPKLSNSLKPTKINEILSNSLQTLTTEDLRPMSEAITNMDNIKDQLEALKLSLQSAKNINNTYQQYNTYQLQKKANAYLQSANYKTTLQKDISSLEKEIIQATKAVEEHKQYLENLRVEEDNLKFEKSTLASKDIERLNDELQQFTTTLQQNKQTIVNKQSFLESKNNRCIDTQQSVTKMLHQKESLAYSLEKKINRLDELQTEIQFSEHVSLKQEVFSQLDKPYDFTYTTKRIHESLTLLQKGSTLLQQIATIKQQYDNYSNEKEKAVDRLQSQQKKIEKLENEYYQALDQLKLSLYNWNQKNRYLVFEESQLKQLTEYMMEYISSKDHSAFNQVIYDKQRSLLQEMDRKMNQYLLLDKAIKEELQNLDNELLRLENMEEPVPTRSEAILHNRQYLKEQGISFKSIYQFIDFDQVIAMEKKNQLEEFLDITGLLDTIVVSKKYREQVLAHRDGQSDRYIFVEDVDAIDTFIIDNRQDTFDIAMFLKHLGCQQADLTYYQENYRFGFIEGTLSGQQESIYLGEQTRKVYQQQCILQVRKSIEEKEEELKVNHENIEALKGQEKEVDHEFQALPSWQGLDTLLQVMMQNDAKLESLQAHLQIIEEQMQVIKQQLVNINTEVQGIALQLNINSTQDAFIQSQEYYNEYLSYLQEFRVEHSDYLHCLELYTSQSEQLIALQEDIDTLHGELQRLKQDNKRLDTDIMNLEKKLQDMGYEQIKQRLQTITTRLLQIPKDIEECIKNIASQEKDMEMNSHIIEEKTQALEVEQIQVAFYKKVFEDEQALSYVEIPEEFLQALKTASEFGISNMNLHDDLQATFYRNNMNLQEYNLTIHSILDYQDQRVSPRLDISAKYQGKRVTFNELVTYLQKDIELQELLLNQQDRDLFEDILVGNISKKIRKLIQNSRIWVDNINQYIDDMNTSSGLKLKLIWKSVKAQNPDEMDSSKLVSLLQKDAAILDKKDLDKISKHFRSKIEAARKQASREDNVQSFHQLMKEIMDYRNWFTFTIMYQKPGDVQKELTNTAFYAFSGGEKAMTMYIPLFSAVAAKFASASKDAPCIIALDEAFAGVDERNIENMFALIDKFDFDYIMNSQILWGDYATVKSLAIYELFRPENARFVTIMNYKWNGKVKEMIA